MVAKVYCEKCDSLFDSREQFNKHLESGHGSVDCQVCIIDMALSKISSFFKR